MTYKLLKTNRHSVYNTKAQHGLPDLVTNQVS